MAEEHETGRTVSDVIVATVAAGFALYFGRELFQPIAVALMLMAVFRPPVRALEAARVPTALAAGIVVLGLMLVIAVVGMALAPPVKQSFAQSNQTLAAAEARLSKLRKPVEQITDVANRLEQATRGPTTAVVPEAPAPQAPSWVASFFGTTTQFLSAAVGTLLMLYLLLATGDLFLQKIVKLMPARRDKAVARQVVTDVENAVMRYLLVTLAINVGQALLVWGVMWMLKMPHPLMWGVATVVLEFVPYLGAAVMIALLAISAAASFDSIGHILLAPASYLVITTIQNNLVSPFAYGNGLKLNPVAILIGVLLWWFLWGIPGAFVAVPILATIKIVADRTDGLHGLGEFLGE
jgi:predicted PurR-regulated permease PerM